MKKIINSDWFLLIIAAILGMIALISYTPTTKAQSITKVNKTTVVITTNTPAKQDTVKTKYVVIIDSIAYPVYLNPKSGSMFIVRTSKKTGKPYKVYSIKGYKINELFRK